MLTRRSFLRNAALTASAVPFLSASELINPVPKNIGVQLWSVRDDMKKDAKGTIEAIAKMGYRQVEPFGFDGGNLFGLSYADFNSLLKSNGLTMPSTHSMFTLAHYNEATNDITDDAKKIIDNAAKYGAKYIIAPWMKEEDRKSIDKMAKALNAAGKYAKKAGIRQAYHNHNFEFEQKAADGRLLIECLLHDTDPSLVTFEMDIYWVVNANYNPLDMFRLYPGRWELCHAKDLAATDKRESIEVGDGTINFKKIFKHADQAGLKYYIVELENYVTTPIQGVKRARKNLVKVF
jgi:sugar phosphate isomerase/epimerase